MFVGAVLSLVFGWMLVRGFRGTSARERAARKAWEIRHPLALPWED